MARFHMPPKQRRPKNKSAQQLDHGPLTPADFDEAADALTRAGEALRHAASTWRASPPSPASPGGQHGSYEAAAAFIAARDPLMTAIAVMQRIGERI